MQISISDDEVSLLSAKLNLVRLPVQLASAQWTESSHTNMDIGLLQSIESFWKSSYSWRDEEARLNLLPQFVTNVATSTFGNLDIHFVHSRSNTSDSIALLFLHGWPGSFLEIVHALPLLNDASFDVVAPSLPGFGFSTCPEASGFNFAEHADVMQHLMLRLGYDRYVVQGGDCGAGIGRQLALKYPDSAIALHVNSVSCPNHLKNRFSRKKLTSNPE